MNEDSKIIIDYDKLDKVEKLVDEAYKYCSYACDEIENANSEKYYVSCKAIYDSVYAVVSNVKKFSNEVNNQDSNINDIISAIPLGLDGTFGIDNFPSIDEIMNLTILSDEHKELFQQFYTENNVAGMMAILLVMDCNSEIESLESEIENLKNSDGNKELLATKKMELSSLMYERYTYNNQINKLKYLKEYEAVMADDYVPMECSSLKAFITDWEANGLDADNLSVPYAYGPNSLEMGVGHINYFAWLDYVASKEDNKGLSKEEFLKGYGLSVDNTDFAIPLFEMFDELFMNRAYLHMTDIDRRVYDKIYEENGPDAANTFLKEALNDDIEDKHGAYLALKDIEEFNESGNFSKLVSSYGKGLTSIGPQQWADNVSGWLMQDESITYNEKRQMYLQSYLMAAYEIEEYNINDVMNFDLSEEEKVNIIKLMTENGKDSINNYEIQLSLGAITQTEYDAIIKISQNDEYKEYSDNTKEFWKKSYSNLLQVGTIQGNSTVSIATSFMFGGGGFGKIAASIASYASSAGGVYRETKRKGWDETKSTQVGMLSGTFEVGLEYLLGNTPGVSRISSWLDFNKGDTWKKTAGKFVLQQMWGLLGEEADELSQVAIGYKINEILLGEEFPDNEQLLDEMIKTAEITALSNFMMGTAPATIKFGKYSIEFKVEEMQNIKNEQQFVDLLSQKIKEKQDINEEEVLTELSKIKSPEFAASEKVKQQNLATINKALSEIGIQPIAYHNGVFYFSDENIQKTLQNNLLGIKELSIKEQIKVIEIYLGDQNNGDIHVYQLDYILESLINFDSEKQVKILSDISKIIGSETLINSIKTNQELSDSQRENLYVMVLENFDLSLDERAKIITELNTSDYQIYVKKMLDQYFNFDNPSDYLKISKNYLSKILSFPSIIEKAIDNNWKELMIYYSGDDHDVIGKIFESYLDKESFLIIKDNLDDYVQFWKSFNNNTLLFKIQMLDFISSVAEIKNTIENGNYNFNFDVDMIIRYTLGDNDIIKSFNTIVANNQISQFLTFSDYVISNYCSSNEKLGGLDAMCSMAEFFVKYNNLSLELLNNPNILKDNLSNFLYLLKTKNQNLNIQNLEDFLNLNSIINNEITNAINNPDIKVNELKNIFLTYFCNMSLEQFKNILSYEINPEIINKILNKDLSDSDRQKIETLLVYINFINDTINSTTDVDSLKRLLGTISTETKRGQYQDIYSYFTFIEEFIRQAYEIDANATLTKLDSLPQGLYNEEFGYYDLSNSVHAFYVHATNSSNLDGLVNPRMVGIQNICLSATSHKMRPKFFTGNARSDLVLFLYDEVPKGGFIGSSSGNLASNSTTRKNKYRVATRFINDEMISNASETSNSETNVYRTGMIPKGVLMMGDVPTDAEKAAAKKLGKLLGLNGPAPIIKTQNKYETISNPQIIPGQKLKQDSGTPISSRLEGLVVKLESFEDDIMEIIELSDIRRVENRRTRLGASHDLYFCEYNGSSYLLKPAQDNTGEKAPHRAYASLIGYNIQQLIKPDGAVAVQLLQAPIGKGEELIDCAAVEVIPNATNMSDYTEGKIKLTPKQSSDLLVELIVDHLIFNYDIKGANFITDGETVYGIDKEQALKFATSQTKHEIQYDRSSSDDTGLYGVFLQSYKSGTQEIPDTAFDRIVAIGEQIPNLSDDEYFAIFEDYVLTMSHGDKDLYNQYRAKILERKNSLGQSIETFIMDVNPGYYK